MTEDNADLHSVTNLKGVGPKISESLRSLGILSVQDAMFHLAQNLRASQVCDADA